MEKVILPWTRYGKTNEYHFNDIISENDELKQKKNRIPWVQLKSEIICFKIHITASRSDFS